MLIAVGLVIVFFKDIRTERSPFVFRPRDITDSLWRVREHPLVLRIMPVYALFMTANVTFYIFVDNYLTSAFGYGVIGGSVAMLVIGVALATSSTFLVKPAQERFGKRQILGASLLTMVVCGPPSCCCPGPISPTFRFSCSISFRRRLPDLARHLFQQCQRGRPGLGDGCDHRRLLSCRRHHVPDRRWADELRHPIALRHRGGDGGAGLPAAAGTWRSGSLRQLTDGPESG